MARAAPWSIISSTSNSRIHHDRVQIPVQVPNQEIDCDALQTPQHRRPFKKQYEIEFCKRGKCSANFRPSESYTANPRTTTQEHFRVDKARADVGAYHKLASQTRFCFVASARADVPNNQNVVKLMKLSRQNSTH
jgi:hypothetical protein